MKEFKNDLKGFPVEIVEKMLERQVEQGNKRDVSVFERDRTSWKLIGGFAWKDTKEGFHFWNTVITYKKFDHFFEKYPKMDFPVSLHDCKIELKYNQEEVSYFYDNLKGEISEPISWSVDMGRMMVDPSFIEKAKIIYAEGKEVIFDLDSICIENGMLIIKAK